MKHMPVRKAPSASLKRRDSILDLIRIFDLDCQITVVNRARIPVVESYLKAVAPQLGAGFRHSLQAGEPLPSRLLPEHANREAFAAEIDFLVELYCDLLGCPAAGVRLEVMRHAMCPRFHVDHTGIRLLCTYLGPGTEWLEDSCADRSKLGPRSAHITDEESGLILDSAGIHCLAPFSIALLKGSAWQHNERGGVIHRSPQLDGSAHPRVLLAIDGLW